MKKFLLSSVAALVGVLMCTSPAFATFSYNRTVTIDHNKVPSTQTNFTALLLKSHADLRSTGDGGHVQSASGFDIRPHTNSSCTDPMPFKLERYTTNGSVGEVIMWVNVASISSSVDTVYYLCYGDTGLVTDGSSTSAWDSSYKGVYLMNENAGNTTVTDASTSGNNAITINNTSSITTTGNQGLGFTFDGSSEYIHSFSAVPSSTTFTVTAWVNIGASNTGYRTIYAGGGSEPGLWLNARQMDWFDGSIDAVVGGTTIPTSQWHMVAVRHNGNGTNILVYYDGALDGTSGSTSNTDLPDDSTAGIGGHNLEFFNGTMDTTTISNVDRGADWITTTFNSQGSPSTFASLGSEGAPTGGGGATKNCLTLLGTGGPCGE